MCLWHAMYADGRGEIGDCHGVRTLNHNLSSQFSNLNQTLAMDPTFCDKVVGAKSSTPTCIKQSPSATDSEGAPETHSNSGCTPTFTSPPDGRYSRGMVVSVARLSPNLKIDCSLLKLLAHPNTPTRCSGSSAAAIWTLGSPRPGLRTV